VLSSCISCISIKFSCTSTIGDQYCSFCVGTSLLQQVVASVSGASVRGEHGESTNGDNGEENSMDDVDEDAEKQHEEGGGHILTYRWKAHWRF